MITFANANLLLWDLCLQENFQMLWKVRPMYIPELFIFVPFNFVYIYENKEFPKLQNKKASRAKETKQWSFWFVVNLVALLAW